MRLYSYIKTYGGYTKSDAYSLYNKDRIKVNGKHKNFSYIIRTNDIVTIDDKIISMSPNLYYLYNKPVGLVCSHDSKQNNIYDSIDVPSKVSSVGRLDKDSHGLLILTNDGDFHHYVLDKENGIEKEYEVLLKKEITDVFLDNLTKSYILRGKDTIPFKVKKISNYQVNVILSEGKYHEIRRVVVLSGNTVVDLKRIRIGNIILDDLEEGKIKKVDGLKDLL